MAAYAQQLLISTGKDDWTSRIEDDGENEAWGVLGREMKKFMGRGGEYADPYHNVVITNSSFDLTEPSSPRAPETETDTKYASAFVFPDFLYFPHIPLTAAGLTSLISGYLKPPSSKLHPSHSALPDPMREKLICNESARKEIPKPISIRKQVTVLICGHGGRDLRCGVYGPVLQKEFIQALARRGLANSNSPAATQDEESRREKTAHVGLISHIGGHKYAGNVIIYVPPEATLGDSGERNPLAGTGIWYGRVEPELVDGVVEETLAKGRIVEELFRGGIGMDGKIYRI